MNDIVVVFNSRLNATGTNRNDLTYNFDWSKLKEAKYEIAMSCNMGTLAWYGDKLAQVFTHFGNTPQVYKMVDNTASQNTEFMGYLFPSTLQNATTLATFLCAKESDNPHFHIGGRPTQQFPRITFRDGTGGLLTDSAGAEIPHYSLTIRLTEVKDNRRDRYE
jgi:hypothetical protein